MRGDDTAIGVGREYALMPTMMPKNLENFETHLIFFQGCTSDAEGYRHNLNRNDANIVIFVALFV